MSLNVSGGTGILNRQVGSGVLVYSTAGNPQFLAKGSAREALRVNAAGTDLEFSGSGAYNLIAEATPLSAPATSITLSGITTSAYRWLKVFCITKNSAAATSGIYVQFNADTTAGNYSYNGLSVSGSTITGYTASSDGSGANIGSTSNTDFAVTEFTIQNILSAMKTMTTNSNNGSGQFQTGQGKWNNQAANITAIKLNIGANNFDIGSYFVVYGIA
jgi:hypothetical protein